MNWMVRLTTLRSLENLLNGNIVVLQSPAISCHAANSEGGVHNHELDGEAHHALHGYRHSLGFELLSNNRYVLDSRHCVHGFTLSLGLQHELLAGCTLRASHQHGKDHHCLHLGLHCYTELLPSVSCVSSC